MLYYVNFVSRMLWSFDKNLNQIFMVSSVLSYNPISLPFKLVIMLENTIVTLPSEAVFNKQHELFSKLKFLYVKCT